LVSLAFAAATSRIIDLVCDSLDDLDIAPGAPFVSYSTYEQYDTADSGTSPCRVAKYVAVISANVFSFFVSRFVVRLTSFKKSDFRTDACTRALALSRMEGWRRGLPDRDGLFIGGDVGGDPGTSARGLDGEGGGIVRRRSHEILTLCERVRSRRDFLSDDRGSIVRARARTGVDVFHGERPVIWSRRGHRGRRQIP
jgi:hypothetical protein